METDQSNDTNALAALRLLIEQSGAEAVTAFINYQSRENKIRIAALLGTIGDVPSNTLLNSMMNSDHSSYEITSSVVRGLSKSTAGQEKILELASAQQLPNEVALLAGGLLSRSADEAIRWKALQVLPKPNLDASNPLPPLDVLVRLEGDAAKGLQVFRGVATCSNCHVVSGYGKKVGPNLSEIGSKLSREALYAAILAPSAGISHNYENYLAMMDEDRVLSGLLIAQTEDRIVLRNADAIDIEIETDDLIELRKSDRSIMPEGLHQTTDQQGLVDLVSYLMTLKAK